MAFQPITYAGQYPPLKSRSASDVASFAALHASLRQSLPELAREGDRILNEEMLARFVDGVSRFQRDHLGRKSKSRYWPALRLPSPLLSDRKSYPNGPLGVMVLSAFRIKQVSAWRNFNFDNAKLFDDNVSIIKRMESDLTDRGYLRRPAIYFDASVEAGLGREELRRLAKIALRFGAKVLEGEEALSSGRVTHVVAYDPEEHDAADVIEEERERERRREEEGGGGDDDEDRGGGDGGGMKGGERPYPSEKKFLRTLAVVDSPIPDDGGDDGGDGDGGGAGTTASSGSNGRRKATRKMALVHWWYHPSSYDEWLPAGEVSAAVEGDENHGIVPGGGPCVVGCKFVRDVERFNEWGVEADYAVMEYGRKVDCLRPDRVGGEENGTKSSRTNKGNKRVVADDDGEGGASNKKQRTGQGGGDDDDEDDAEVEVGASSSSSSSTTPVVAAAPSSGKSKSKNMGGQVKTSPGAAAAVGGNRRPTSERRACGGGGGGMNPRGILTGLRGQRGEVVRRTVHDGALRVEDGAHAVVRDALADYLLGNATTTTTSAAGGGGRSAATVATAAAIALPPRTPTLAARPEWRKLLPATGFVRPSVDASLGCMIVTELTLGERGEVGSSSSCEDAADVVGATTTAPTLAANRTVPILIPLEEVVAAAVGPGIVVAAGCGEEGPLTMRGGGGGSEEDSGDGQTWQQQREMADFADFAVAVDGESDLDEVIRPPGGQSPAVGVGGPLNASTEDAGDLETPDSGDNVDARCITDPCDDPTAVLEDVAMQVKEEGTASIAASEEGIGEDVAALEADGPPPEEMHAGEDVADTGDATNAGEDMPSELDEDAMHFVGDPASLPPAESVEEELGAHADDAPPEDFPSGERQEIGAPPPVADDGVPCAAAEREPSGPSPEAKLMEVDPSAAVVETYSAAAEVAPEEVDASTEETAVAPLVHGLDSTNDVANIVVAGKQPSGAMPTSATDIPTAQLHTASATSGTKVASNIVAQVSSSTAPTPVALDTTEDTPSKTLVAASVLSDSAAKASSIASSSDSIVLCQVVSLPPNTHLSNTLVNNPQSNEGDSKSGPERPSWYHPTKPSEFEKRTLSEWFNCTAPHRTEFTYIATRENILSLAKRNTQQFITSTAVRRSVPGDAGSLLRLHKFLMDFGLLNGGQIGETAPSDAILRGLHAAGGALAGSKRKHTSAVAWTSDRVHALEASVVKHVSKKSIEGSPDQVNIVVNWDAVASDVGGGATPSDCQCAFVNPPAEDVKTAISSKNSVFSRILDGVHPEVLKAVVEASLQSTNDINEARKASFVAIMAGAAAQKGAQTESEIENTLMDIVDLRIQRLENRVALLDDVEALLEAERVSLELERRDMYTARCRHWFGDGSS